MSEQQQSSVLEKILAYTSVSIIVIAVGAFLTTLIAAMVSDSKTPSEGFFLVVSYISYIGLPIGFVLLIALLIVNFTRRGREK